MLFRRQALLVGRPRSHTVLWAPRRSSQSAAWRTGRRRRWSLSGADSRRAEETPHSTSQAEVWQPGPDPNQCFLKARRARDATLQDDDVVANDTPATTALPSRAPARVDAHQLKFSSSICGTTLFKAATIPPLDNELNLKYSLHKQKTFNSPLSQVLKLFYTNQSQQCHPPPVPPPSPASQIRSHKRITEYFSVMDPYLRHASIWFPIEPFGNILSQFIFSLWLDDDVLSVILFSGNFNTDCKHFSFWKDLLCFQLSQAFSNSAFSNTNRLVFQGMATDLW